jgi:lipopolysaccharide export LptBFGC system permease protein LptF
MLAGFIALLQQVDIEEKLKNAPDDGYEIGLVIGTYLPFVFFAAIAYWVYYKAKNRKDLDD